MKKFYTMPEIPIKIFGNNLKLLPSVDELFELELAHLEYSTLNEQELIERSAFFESVNGIRTNHYKLYATPHASRSEGRSAQTKSYFENGQFSTGYATHGLFPYRGKFHPQLIKGLLNILGVKPGETILDPMCGSGTANIEAALLGINSYAVDQSPFCQFMTKTKHEALTIGIEALNEINQQNGNLFSFFDVKDIFKRLEAINDPEKSKVYDLALLAFLDSMGYSMRVTMSSHKQLFEKVIRRYYATVHSLLSNPHFKKEQVGSIKVLANSNAMKLELVDSSVDCIITSPPYSFAIDYVKNDAPQLNYLGCDIDAMRSKMIGLIGKNISERLNNYFDHMKIVCSEVARVLKKGKYFVMIIGSNTNQTGGIRLEGQVIESAKKSGLTLVKSILKPIKGMRNIMREEYILFFEKT